MCIYIIVNQPFTEYYTRSVYIYFYNKCHGLFLLSVPSNLSTGDDEVVMSRDSQIVWVHCALGLVWYVYLLCYFLGSKSECLSMLSVLSAMPDVSHVVQNAYGRWVVGRDMRVCEYVQMDWSHWKDCAGGWVISWWG